jgi:hypothetical protein
MFQPSISDENETRKRVASHFLPDFAVPHWHPITVNDRPTDRQRQIDRGMVWVKLRWLEPTRHKRGLLGGCDAHAGGKTSVGTIQAR